MRVNGVLRILLASTLILSASSTAFADKKCDSKIHKQIVLRMSFAYDRGCMFEKLVVKGKSYDDVGPATPKALAVLGWKKTKPAKREEIAMTWITDVLARVGEWRVVFSTNGNSDDFKQKFYEPKTTITDGVLTVRFWRDVTIIGMRRPDTRDFVETQVTFAADGAMTMTDVSTFAEPF